MSQKDVPISEILFATSNSGKLADARRFFEKTGIRVLSIQDISERSGVEPPEDVEETGETYQENAKLKVNAYFAWSGVPTIADDSGIEVAALGGEPAVYSARYAGEGCTYDDNIRKMLQELQGKSDRAARFVCVVAYTQDGSNVHFEEGIIEGQITEEKLGDGGFGYDPIFSVKGKGKTLSELKEDPEEHLDTHRTRALESMVSYLASI